DETICEISTDKIDTEVPAPVSGVVTEILVEVETTVSVGTVLARIAGGDGAGAQAPASTQAPGPSDSAGTPAPAAPEPAPVKTAPARNGAPPNGHRRRYSPVVQRIAAEHGIDLA